MREVMTLATVEKRRGTRTRGPESAVVPPVPAQPERRQYAHLGTKGQLVVPASLRRELGLQPGQKLRIEAANGRLLVTPVPTDLIERLHGCLAGSGDLLGDLMRDHREEIERDEAYIAGLGDQQREPRPLPRARLQRNQASEGRAK